MLGLLVLQAQLVHNHTRAAVHQLGVRQLHVHHLVALNTTHLDHRGRRYHVANQLLSRAALQTSRTRHKLRTYNSFDRYICFLRNRSVRVHRDTRSQNAVLAGMPQCAHYIRRRARGCNTNHGVQFVNPTLLQLFPALLRVVLGFLNGISQSRVTTCYQTHNKRRRHSERGRNLRCVQHTQTTTRSCAKIKYPAAFLHTRYNLLYQLGNLRNSCLHGQRNLLVLFVHFRQQFFY